MDSEGKTEDDEWLNPDWDAAIDRQLELEGWQKGQEPKHELVQRFTYFCAVMAKLHLDMADQKWSADEVLLRQPYEAMVLGAEFLAAWSNRDAAFFEDLARVALIEAGTRRLAGDCIERAVIEIASELWTKEKGNPTRDEVMQEAKRRGIKPGNWSKTFKRCHLDFLKGRKRGRPSTKMEKP